METKFDIFRHGLNKELHGRISNVFFLSLHRRNSMILSLLTETETLQKQNPSFKGLITTYSQMFQ